MNNGILIAEYWTGGHPDDMHDGTGEGFDVSWASADAQPLIAKAKAELETRFKGEDLVIRVQNYDDRFPETHFAVKASFEGAESTDEDFVAYFLIHPVELI